MNKIDQIFDKLDPNLLLKCYSDVTNSVSMHKHFEKMNFDPSKNDERIRIYRIYVNLMLPKCMNEKGHEGLKNWTGTTGGKLRTSGGNCVFTKKLIQIADWLIENDITKFEDLREVILHEIAHANAWLKHGVIGHGPVWIREARQIGCTGERCMPKKFSAALFECAIYKCRYPSDKCICVKSGSKQALTLFSKKMPTLVCKKHKVPYDFIETKKVEDFKKEYGLSFGNGRENEEVVIVEDGEVIEVDEDGEVYSVEPDTCIKYD